MAKKGSRTPPLYMWEEFSEAKFKSMLKSDLRRLWLRWPPRAAALVKARRQVEVGQFKNGNPKMGYEHQCAMCKEWFPQVRGGTKNTLRPDVEVDHIVPVGGFSGDIENWGEDLGQMYQRSLVGVDELRIACKPCHHIITHGEKK